MAQGKMKVGLLVNPYKDRSFNVSGKAEEILRRLGSDVVSFVLQEKMNETGKPVFPDISTLFKGCDLVISLGGDGTFLHAVHAAYRDQIPVAGVNLGSLGFLAEIQPESLEESLERLVRGDYCIERRTVLDARVCNAEGELLHRDFSMNEVALSRGNCSRILPIELWIDNTFTEIIRSDGLMVSTPTGSTGYAMAAGGPIIQPTLELMLITPICPHSLHNRSYIISPDSVVELRLRSYPFKPVLSIDGQHDIIIEPGSSITVRQAPVSLKMARMDRGAFFADLPDKIRGRAYVESEGVGRGPLGGHDKK